MVRSWMIAVAIFLISAQALAISYCRNAPGTEAKYCVHKDLRSKNPDIIFHFHCLFGDHTFWKSMPLYRHVRKQWKESGFDAPTVVTISYGRSWLLAPKGESPLSGLYEEVRDQVIPHIEAELGFRPEKGERHILGLSMGGFNGAQFYLREPGMFSKVALLCPAMAVIGPYADQDEIENYVSRNNANEYKVKLAVALARKYFSKSDWEQQSPINFARKNLSRGAPELYLFAGQADSFGFFEGNLTFYQIGLRAGAPVTWYENEYGHCFFNPKKVANFFAEKN